MVRVIFVAPFNMPVTMRFVAAVAELPDVQVGLITQEPSDVLAPELRQRLAAHYRVADGLDFEHLVPAVLAVGKQLGGIDPLNIAWSMAVSASLVDLSSLSTVGALYMASAAEGTDTRKLFNSLLIWGLSMSVVGAPPCCASITAQVRLRPRAKEATRSPQAATCSWALAPSRSSRCSPRADACCSTGDAPRMTAAIAPTPSRGLRRRPRAPRSSRAVRTAPAYRSTSAGTGPRPSPAGRFWPGPVPRR